MVNIMRSGSLLVVAMGTLFCVSCSTYQESIDIHRPPAEVFSVFCDILEKDGFSLETKDPVSGWVETGWKIVSEAGAARAGKRVKIKGGVTPANDLCRVYVKALSEEIPIESEKSIWTLTTSERETDLEERIIMLLRFKFSRP